MKANRIIAAMLICVSLFSFTACFKRDTGEEIDPFRTQLRITFYDGAHGSEWISKLAERFEEQYKEESFEPGKVGVQVLLNGTKSVPLNTLSTDTSHVYFAEAVRYFEQAARGDFLDITDLVREENLPGEEGVLEDKLLDIHKENLPFIDNKYYAVPFYEIFPSIMYDVDLWEDENFYFADPDAFSEQDYPVFVINKNTPKSAGPDNIKGTYDDGLPSSVADYIALMNHMVTKTVTPFIWSGASPGYARTFLTALAANLLGNDFNLTYTFDSKGKDIEIWDESTALPADGVSVPFKTIQTKNVKITPETGYQVYQLPAFYYALKLLEAICGESLFRSDSVMDYTATNLQTQEDFICSKYENRDKPIAMLMERSFWENEAIISGAFERSQQRFPFAPKDRRFGFMPLPTSVNGEKTGEQQQTMFDVVSSYAFINGYMKDPVKIDLSKKFLLYAYTDTSIKEFTLTTNTTRAIKYDLTNEELEQMSYFGQSVWNVKKNSNILRVLGDSRITMENTTQLLASYYVTKGIRESGTPLPGDQPARLMIATRNRLTAAEYFKGMTVTKSEWDIRYGKYWL